VQTEIAAAYERIDELEKTLQNVRCILRDGHDPFDIIEAAVDAIDRALDERVPA
jgi:hypothetical protein